MFLFFRKEVSPAYIESEVVMFLPPATKMEKFIRTVDVPIYLLDVFVDGNVATCKSWLHSRIYIVTYSHLHDEINAFFHLSNHNYLVPTPGLDCHRQQGSMHRFTVLCGRLQRVRSKWHRVVSYINQTRLD
jgi:hypothetical protein